jgi:predicted membrane-bound mannosyltransferase
MSNRKKKHKRAGGIGSEMITLSSLETGVHTSVDDPTPTNGHTPEGDRIPTNGHPRTQHVTELLRGENELVWRYGSWAILTVATALRFLFLTLKPFHHDEGVNGFFLTGLFRDGVYKYDPTNYHGPSLYYFALFSSWIFGLDDLAVRIVVAVFGFLTVCLIFSLRKYLGTIGTLFAALLAAVSPGLTYFSRYFIHEILLVFFTFGCAVCVVKFIDGTRPGKIATAAMALMTAVCLMPFGLQITAAIASPTDEVQLPVLRFVMVVVVVVVATVIIVRSLVDWDEGRPIYLFLASGCASMTFATKETSFISLGTMLIAVCAVWAWLRFTADGENGLKNRRTGLALAGGGTLLLALYFNADLRGGIGWFYTTYISNPEGREASIVFVGIAVLFAAAVEMVRRYVKTEWKTTEPALNETGGLTRTSLRDRTRSAGNAPGLIFATAIVFALVGIVFFSSFLTYEKGVNAAFEAYNIWAKTGSQDHAQNGTWAYLKWTVGAEAPILILAAAGAVIAFVRSRNKFAMFASLWAFGLFAAYTIIPYKTPWIGINFVLPMTLVAGYGINELVTSREEWKRTAAMILGGLALAICIYQCIELNFFRYDDDRRPYVYVHSLRSMNEMVNRIDSVIKGSNAGDKATIVITSPENWPLPWTMHRFKGAAFYGAMITNPNAEIVIGSVAQQAELEKNYSPTHILGGKYGLRPGVDLLLYLRKDLANN